eukprot:scaffold236714_cov49-Attheya_sp.AAC.2
MTYVSKPNTKSSSRLAGACPDTMAFQDRSTMRFENRKEESGFSVSITRLKVRTGRQRYAKIDGSLRVRRRSRIGQKYLEE